MEEEELQDGFKMGSDGGDDELLDDDLLPPEDVDFGLDEEDPDQDH